MTPLMKQYNQIKAAHPGCILFFRMGDFYELFDDDAIIASKVLSITLTNRNNGAAKESPLCGFPHHAAERYIPKMLSAGYRVAVCEQMEDPKFAKGIVKRDVVEIISAGTSFSENNLEAKQSSYICAFLCNKNEAVLAIADISTGYFAVGQSSIANVESEIERRSPKEILVQSDTEIPANIQNTLRRNKIMLTEAPQHQFEPDFCQQILEKHFNNPISSNHTPPFGHPSLTAQPVFQEGNSQLISAAGALLFYLLEQKKSGLSHIIKIDSIPWSDYMALDPATQRNLELTAPLHPEDSNSTLLSVMDFTKTAMGARCLREWISHPLVSIESISSRLSCVEELVHNPMLLDEIGESMKPIPDMERAMGRVGSGRANARDVQSLGRSLLQAERIIECLQKFKEKKFSDIAEKLQPAKGKGQEICAVLKDELPLTIKEGKLIREGASPEIESFREKIKRKKDWLANLETQERERLGIPSLKVGYNKVFGYYIEITSTHGNKKVPSEYIRKQTLSTGERYITPEMKEVESFILNAESQLFDKEYKVFCKLRDRVHEWRADLQIIASAISDLDCLSSFALAARRYGLTKPHINSSDKIKIAGGRHPVLSAQPDIQFIPNEIDISNSETRFMLITGPNMAGKSTYLRQTALITLLAQIGSFVPADLAEIGIVDKIFTRVGASDRLARGLSTFMLEMTETANILQNATPKSLILLDEIGRGTSTFDGLSIAWAITEFLHDTPEKAAKTIFATHYHELTNLIENLDNAKNFQIAVKENNGKLLFLRKVLEGACDSSYGIHVAEMAGVPDDVVRRAKRILLRLEKEKIDPSDNAHKRPTQLSLFEPPPVDEDTELLLKELRAVNLDEMTPIQALQFLSKIKGELL
ncbi:MAG: DNA mismatch repair protein MutS [Fibromonadaceae bacterium]|jgi:DNA mismatch repair protein MutS|nr:DNA mismatch repair protein MutS [Fibromonadaceae bacterium]